MKELKLTDQLAEELHRPVVRRFPKRRVVIRGIDEIWAADLVDMKAFAKDNNGFKYLLTVLDTFSKFGWIVSLKDKTGKSTADGFVKILGSSGRKPLKVWVDKGREFYNKDVKKLVELYSMENEEKSCLVERWNRAIRDQMFQYFSANSTRKYIDVLDALVDQYNND